MRAIHVSVDLGETWNMAQLPPVSHEQFYSILAANDEMVFMHVDEPGGWWFLLLYLLYYICSQLGFSLQCFSFFWTNESVKKSAKMLFYACQTSRW